MVHALLEWLYTNGARASEPGLARMRDVDLHAGTVQLTHLKGGLAAEPLFMSKRCLAALEAWLAVKPKGDYVFPSAKPRPCYPCRGEGRILAKRQKKEPVLVPCPHCHATGVRQGMTRHEVARVIVRVFTLAGIPAELRFPHILRHSAVTRMLNKGTEPTAIQERVGHKSLATTLGYMHTTEAARAKVNEAFDED
jgi:integrase